jgi:hypothetical protein
MLEFFDHPSLLALSLGVVVGMVSWDLAFEAQPVLDAIALDAVYDFYRVLQGGQSPSLLMLLVAILCAGIHLVRRVAMVRDTVSVVALVCFVFMLGIELGIAVPAEAKLTGLGPVSAASPIEIESMREYTLIARNVHLAMLPLLLIPIWLCRKGIHSGK